MSGLSSFNTDTTLYGSYRYDAAKDVARFRVIPQKSHRFYETLTLDIDLIPNNARIYVSWAHTQIAFDVITTTDEEILTYINDTLLTDQTIPDPDDYAMAAGYLIFQHTNLRDALTLTDKAIAANQHSWARRLKMEIYEELFLYEEALKAARNGLETEKTRPYEKDADRLLEVKNWEAHVKRLEEEG